MFAARTTHAHAELIRWLLLGGLASIAIYFLTGQALGQQTRPPEDAVQRIPAQGDFSRPIPMPNVDNPDLFRYPYDTLIPHFESASLNEVIDMHRQERH